MSDWKNEEEEKEHRPHCWACREVHTVGGKRGKAAQGAWTHHPMPHGPSLVDPSSQSTSDTARSTKPAATRYAGGRRLGAQVLARPVAGGQEGDRLGMHSVTSALIPQLPSGGR